jgi:GH43 family beta-xylosidase
VLQSTYINPVHNRPCPDPFVLKYLGEYWCYSTGFGRDGRVFGIMRSRDLVAWRELAGAMEPLSEGYTCYWAPEVTYYNGRFFMYYSAGNEERMQIRVAVAPCPEGPFIDSGRGLSEEDFAIDPHVFEDSDGAWYMFYATDFLSHTHIGTGTVMDRMIDPFTLAKTPRPVTRARYDWQVYDPNRREKGGVRWHTVEGPFVLKHKGRYYEMFSGGNWKNLTYGVSYAVIDDINAQDEWEQASDGERVLPILRTLPGRVIGPGHNSVVRGPDNQQLFCVYHRWAEDGSDRVLAIDRQDWAGGRMIILGPSTTLQPAPTRPAVDGFSDKDDPNKLSDKWGGGWVLKDGVLIQEREEAQHQAASYYTEHPYYVLELSLKTLKDSRDEGYIGLAISCERAGLRFSLVPGSKQAVLGCEGEDFTEQRVKLPAEFDMSSFHLLRVQVRGEVVSFALDGLERWQSRIAAPPTKIELLTHKVSAAFAGAALTYGWEDLFTEHTDSPSEAGWEVAGSGGSWRIRDQQLWSLNGPGQHSTIAKGPLFESYELVVNAMLEQVWGANACYGFYPMLGESGSGTLFTVEEDSDNGWSIFAHAPSGRQAFPLPEGFDPVRHHQFRFRKSAGRLIVQFEALVLGEVKALLEPSRVGLFARSARAAFDMVRVTAIIDNM